MSGNIKKSEVRLDGRYVRIVGDKSYQSFGPGQWHRTEAAAKVRAEQMRVERIASLKKQIKKLEGIKF